MRSADIGMPISYGPNDRHQGLGSDLPMAPLDGPVTQQKGPHAAGRPLPGQGLHNGRWNVRDTAMGQFFQNCGTDPDENLVFAVHHLPGHEVDQVKAFPRDDGVAVGVDPMGAACYLDALETIQGTDWGSGARRPGDS